MTLAATAPVGAVGAVEGVEAATPVVSTVATTDVSAIIDQDVRMDSPPPLSRHELQGASSTTEGILRGRAYGNKPNIADLVDQDDPLIPIIGKVYVYIIANDPITSDFTAMKHNFVIKHSVTSSLAKILTEIGDRHSPVRSKIYFFYII